jgi:hypothetical protein
MLRDPAVDPGARLTWHISIGLIMAAMLMGLLCVASSAFAFHQQVIRKVMVVQVGQWLLSAEVTYNPQCAPLAETCWVSHYRSGRRRYFSTWVYRTTPPNVPWKLERWHVIDLSLGREAQ